MQEVQDKPYSPSCDRNREPILGVLEETLGQNSCHVLEIGSGTGQHALYFSDHFSNVVWWPTDSIENHDGINQWIAESKNWNIKAPQVYHAGQDNFPHGHYDIIYTANTLHIMSFDSVKNLISDIGKSVYEGTSILIYGPFNYEGKYTSDSNAKFDIWLKERNPQSAIRNFEDIVELFNLNGMYLTQDIEMPANNRLLIFKK